LFTTSRFSGIWYKTKGSFHSAARLLSESMNFCALLIGAALLKEQKWQYRQGELLLLPT
jgi:hypothetical protein